MKRKSMTEEKVDIEGKNRGKRIMDLAKDIEITTEKK